MKYLNLLLINVFLVFAVYAEQPRFPRAGAAGITISGSIPTAAISAFELNKEHFVKVEASQAVRLYGNDRLALYIEYFRKGMESKSELITIEGSDNLWLEVAFSRGYYARMFFISGFLACSSSEK